MARQWHRFQQEIVGWTFYASRQASSREDLSGSSIRVGEFETVDADTFLVQTEVDDERKLLHLVAWHPSLAGVPEEHHMQIFFLLLDEAFGEFGTDMWFAGIEIRPFEPDGNTRSLLDLPLFVNQVNEYYKWDKHPPLDTYSVFQMNEQHEGQRGDTIAGTSILPSLICEYTTHQRLEDSPFSGTGAHLIYVALDNRIFPDASQITDVRGNIEDQISDLLTHDLSGEVVGGATGINHSYIDIVVYDGQRSVSRVKQALEQLNLSGRYTLEKIK